MNPFILIVDDDPALLQALPAALRLRVPGVIVDTCDSARIALARIAATDYDAIISDIKMPGMDGLALLAEIRALRPETPTLLITGHGEHDLAVQALRGGAYDFIQKPIDRDYFVASLNRATQLRQLSRQVEEQRLALESHASELERLVEERTSELVRANQIKDEFLATVSHELRTPLNAMLGWAQILRTRQLDEATRLRALETIERNARSQSQLIDDLLDVSRIIQGNIRLTTRPLMLASVVEAALDAMRPAIEAKAIRLQFTGSQGGLVVGDAARLQQVVFNLISNAIKYTASRGDVVVRLECADGSAKLIVSDTGQGIGASFLPYVFERFRQADSTTTRTHGGLGLGLAIVRHLVELHGGTVQAHSPGEGRGSTFVVSLPLLSVQTDADPEQYVQTESASRVSGMRA